MRPRSSKACCCSQEQGGQTALCLCCASCCYGHTLCPLKGKCVCFKLDGFLPSQRGGSIPPLREQAGTPHHAHQSSSVSAWVSLAAATWAAAWGQLTKRQRYRTAHRKSANCIQHPENAQLLTYLGIFPRRPVVCLLYAACLFGSGGCSPLSVKPLLKWGLKCMMLVPPHSPRQRKPCSCPSSPSMGKRMLRSAPQSW